MSWALLIVEDDIDIREELESIFAARGFHPLAVANGNAALELATRHAIRPAVILLDLHMPVMDGVEFLRRQHDDPLLADVPVIILTAQRELPRDLPSTVRAVLEKPVPLRTLISLVEEICHERLLSGVPRPTAVRSGALRASDVVPDGSESGAKDDEPE